jgi:D-aminoacyl-tRNA deacylase
MIQSLCSEFGFTQNAKAELMSSLRYPNVQLLDSASSLLEREDLDSLYPDATTYVFLSKHKSDSKIPTLTCHCTGNFGHNPYGGNSREIAISFPSLQKEYLRALTRASERVPGYEIVIEATHHGPTSLHKPLLFVELGSSEKQWADKSAASVMCDVLLSVIKEGPQRCSKVGIGLGGTHYPGKFNRLLLGTEFGLAAVASKHNLESIDESMMNQMITKSTERVTSIVLDGKGLGSQKDRIMSLAEKTGLEILNLK